MAAPYTKSPTQSRAGLDGGAVRHTNHCFITKKSGLIAFEANRFIILSDTMTSQLPQSLIAPDYLTSDNTARSNCSVIVLRRRSPSRVSSSPSKFEGVGGSG